MFDWLCNILEGKIKDKTSEFGLQWGDKHQRIQCNMNTKFIIPVEFVARYAL